MHDCQMATLARKNSELISTVREEVEKKNCTAALATAALLLSHNFFMTDEINFTEIVKEL